MRKDKKTYGLGQVALAIDSINKEGLIRDNLHEAFIFHLMPLDSEMMELYFNYDESKVNLFSEIMKDISKYQGQVKIPENIIGIDNEDLMMLRLVPSQDAFVFIEKLSDTEIKQIFNKIKKLHIANCSSFGLVINKKEN